MEHFGTIPFLRTPKYKKFMVKKGKIIKSFLRNPESYSRLSQSWYAILDEEIMDSVMRISRRS